MVCKSFCLLIVSSKSCQMAKTPKKCYGLSVCFLKIKGNQARLTASDIHFRIKRIGALITNFQVMRSLLKLRYNSPLLGKYNPDIK